jgi:hypothetical protein
LILYSVLSEKWKPEGVPLQVISAWQFFAYRQAGVGKHDLDIKEFRD